MPVLRLAIPSPLRSTFDYLPPAGLGDEQAASLLPGTRLKVPFGGRELTGFLLEVCADSELDPDTLKNAIDVLDPHTLLSPEVFQLCQWAAEYYRHPPGEVFSCAFPTLLRKNRPYQALGEAGWRLTDRGKGLPAGGLSRSPRQSQALGLLLDSPTLSAANLSAAGISGSVMRQLRGKGLAEQCTIPTVRTPSPAAAHLSLNKAQQAVLDALLKAGEGFSCHLLEGVTGSGKTEIYLQLIADCLARDHQALVLIPEIGLTPQTLARFQQRFGTNIAVLHSGLSEGERYRAWELARSGSADIVIGTRSAVYTPLARAGLIVVDEEHDLSYKQQDGFRYSARDVAVKRAQLEDCPVLLGSATPSLESLHNALAGRYQLHRLTTRAGGAQLPGLSTLDVRREQLQAGLSAPLLKELETCLKSGQQALLFLNRRGYASSLRCHDCGWIADCKACDARLTIHRRQRQLRCHHCGAGQALVTRCPACHGKNLLGSGLGTQQTEEFLRRHFENWPIYRVDSDSMQGKDAMRELTDKVQREQACILLGTQMLSKGHHFPRVSLVGVIDADGLLFSSDFRGEERLLQMLTQVSGRAGRANMPGQVIVQTHHPDHPLLQAYLNDSYHDQARAMLQQRAATGMPPSGQLILLRTDCTDAERGEQFLAGLRKEVEPRLGPGLTLIGPLPSPMQRRAGRYRCQLILLAKSRARARTGLADLVHTAESRSRIRGLNWNVDVDPQDMF